MKSLKFWQVYFILQRTGVLCINQNTFSSWIKVKMLMKLWQTFHNIKSYHILHSLKNNLKFFSFLLNLSFFSFNFDWHCRNIAEHLFVLMATEGLYRKFFEHSKYRWQDFKLLDHLTFQKLEGDWPYTGGKKVKGSWVRIMLIYFKNPFSFTSQSFV